MKRSAGDKPIDVIEISDDDSPSKQPPQKSARKDEGQFASQPFQNLHQNLVKLEKDYQDACRSAAEAQKHVALLESLLAKKLCASDDTEKEELKKKLAVVSAKLEEATKKNGELIKTDCERGQEIDKLKLKTVVQNKLIEDLQKKIAGTSSVLEKGKAANKEEQPKKLNKSEKDCQEDVGRIANGHETGTKAWGNVLENINDKKPVIAPVTEKNQIALLQSKLAETSSQLENERREGAKRREREKNLHDVVHSLTQQLEAAKARGMEEGKSNGDIRIEQSRRSKEAGDPSGPEKVDAKQTPLEPPLVPPAKTPETPETTEVRLDPVPIGSGSSLLQMCASTMQPPVLLTSSPVKPPAMVPNLFEPCFWSQTSGSMAFLSALGQLRTKYHPHNYGWLENCRQAIWRETHICATCNKLLAGTEILSHFFSRRHINNMRARNAEVPRATFEYWMAKLDSIPKPADPVAVPKNIVSTKADGTDKTLLVPKNEPAPMISVTNASSDALRHFSFFSQVTAATTATAATVTPMIDGTENSIKPESKTAPAPVNFSFLSKVTAATAATAATVTPKEPIPTPKVDATVVVSTTLADETPATKVQVATLTPTVSAPSVALAPVNFSFLSKVFAATTATAATATPKEPTPNPKVDATVVVSTTLADETPAAKVQVATVAPTVTTPTVPPEVVEVVKPVNKE